MTENDKINLQQSLQEDKRTEKEAISTLAVEGEIPCVIIYSDPHYKNLEYVQDFLNVLTQILPKKGFNPFFLSEKIKPLEQYGKKFEQLAEECSLGIVILDGLRPNVVLELGILMGKNKPIIPLQDENAFLAIKSFYPQGCGEAGLTSKEFDKLEEPSLGFFLRFRICRVCIWKLSKGMLH
jgi:hypothetical protein